MNHRNAVAAAAGREKFDLVIRNIQLVNVYTKEVYPAEIAIKDGLIAHVAKPGETLEATAHHDGGGKYAAPGFIDSHVHIESGMMTPANFANVVVPHGTTTVSCDPHEFANVAGMAGVDYVIEASKPLPLSVKVMIPSCVPSALGVETAGANFGADEVEALLARDDVIGLAEVMDYVGVTTNAARMTEIIEAARGKVFLEGHAPKLSGRMLSAYLSSGVNSDHECDTAQEATEKIRAGMTVELRESSVTKNMAELAPAMVQLGFPPNTTFCTDDREAYDLLHEGNMDHVIRRAIQEGYPAVEAIKTATYNAARWLRLYDRGAISPGLRADIVLLRDLDTVAVDEVFYEGALVAKQHKMLSPCVSGAAAFESVNTMKLKTPSLENFRFPVSDGRHTMNIIRIDEEVDVLLHRDALAFNFAGGMPDLSEHPDCALAAVFERHGVNGNIGLCVIQNTHLARGAVAQTVSHDCHNLIVVGKNTADMLIAAKALCESGGGICCADGGELLGLVAFPVAGIVSTLPAEQLAPQLEELKRQISSLGLRGNPLMQLGCFPLAVIPHIRITDMGLVDVATQTVIPLFE